MEGIKINAICKAFIVIFIIMMTMSCGSRKTLTSEGTVTEKDRTDLLSSIKNSELNYSTLSGKMDLEIIPANSKKSMKTASQVKIIKDSIIQISIRPFLGVEVFRITLTPDSVFLLDRYNKKYVEDKISVIEKARGAHFNFYNLQSLLTNTLFLPGKQQITPTDYNLFDVNIESNVYLLKLLDKSGTLYNFAVNASDRIESVLIFTPDKKYTLQWTYSEFIKDNRYIYPTKMVGNAQVNDKRYDVRITYNKLEINKNLDIDTSVSKKYDRVSVNDILKTLLKM